MTKLPLFVEYFMKFKGYNLEHGYTLYNDLTEDSLIGINLDDLNETCKRAIIYIFTDEEKLHLLDWMLL